MSKLFHTRPLSRGFSIEAVVDLEEVRCFLIGCGLSVDDLNETTSTKYFGVKKSSIIVGVAGLDVVDNVALLRSVAVSPCHRGSNLGSALVGYVESRAYSLGIRTVYLLSTTAERYFEGLGYQSVSRELAPDEIRRTRQFSKICPASAVLMEKKLCNQGVCIK